VASPAVLGVQEGDRRLHHVWPPAAQGQRAIERHLCPLDRLEVPERAILIAQEHHGLLVEPGLPAGVVDEHEREQPVDLGLVRHQLGEGAPEPDRLRRQVAAAAVALVEDQIDDGEDRGQPVREEVGWGHPEWDPGFLDLALRPDQPLGHRRLGDDEGARDLLGGQSSERPERQGDLRVHGQRRVTAGEEQLQALIGDRRLIHLFLHCCGYVEQLGLLDERAIPPDPVDSSIPGGCHQPGARVVRRPFARPALGGDRERLLSGLLGQLEAAQEADQGGEDAAPFVSEDPVEVRRHSVTGRTSMAPPMRAAGIFDARSIAASRSSAS
jgi:hypothetical protein